MKYHSLCALAVCCLFALAQARGGQAPDEQQLVRINPERATAGQKAADAIISAYRDGREFDQRDVRLSKAYKIAVMAANINQVARSQTLQIAKHISRGRMREVADASAKVVVAFNNGGAEASFDQRDLRLLQAFQTAVAGADAISRVAMPAAVKNLNKDEITRATEAANRVLTAFNDKGDEATITSNDEEVLRAFLKATSEPKH